MGIITSSGLDAIELEIYKIGYGIPKTIIEKMLDAGADVAVAAQKSTAQSMLNGPRSKGAVAESVTKKKGITSKGGVYTKYITFNGTQHGERLGKIAYINEYGKKGQPARPFIRTANEKCADAVAEAEASVLDEYLNK